MMQIMPFVESKWQWPFFKTAGDHQEKYLLVLELDGHFKGGGKENINKALFFPLNYMVTQVTVVLGPGNNL